MYYVLGKERKEGKKNGAYHVYEITMERKREADAVESLMEFDKCKRHALRNVQTNRQITRFLKWQL